MMDKNGQELLEKSKRELLFSVENGLRCCKNGSCALCRYKDGANDATGCKMHLADDCLTLIGALAAEGTWIYCPDDEGRPRWKCSRCGKIVRKDPAEKLYCATCGQRNRKEA